MNSKQRRTHGRLLKARVSRFIDILHDEAETQKDSKKFHDEVLKMCREWKTAAFRGEL